MPLSLRSSDEEIIEALACSAEALPDVDAPDFAAAFDRFADVEVVLLGEASHGTSEFYRARAAITRRLIELHGFRIVALEADWPDMAELDRFARNRGVWGRQESFARFPRWMWRNAEFAGFVRDLRTWNLHRDAGDRAELRGLDVYSLSRSLSEVLAYLDRVDQVAAAEARRRYGCILPYAEEPQLYGAATRIGSADCEDQVVAQLVALLQRRTDYAAQDGEDFFDAEQNARVIRAAEGYYRAMYRGSIESWNQRDGHMFDTLRRLIAARGAGAKAVVWAHNSHIGDASATAMGWSGEFNIGQLCREAFGPACVSIGFSTDRGKVACADDWDGPMRIKEVQRSREESWEQLLLRAQEPRALVDWRNDPALARALDRVRLERAIGVIYRPQTERMSHYFEARLSRQFDAMVWFEETNPVTPLPGADAEGAPDTYPFGI